MHYLKQEANADSSKVNIEVGENIEYAGYSTCHVTDKQTGYALICAQPSKSTPKAGSYKKDYKWESKVEEPDFSNCETDEERETVQWLYDNRLAMIERVFYFGHPDSPGFNDNFWPSKWYDGNSMNKKRYIALTHVVLSDLYANDLRTATFGCNAKFKEWLSEKITGGYSKGDGKVTADSRKNSVYGKMYHSKTNKDWNVPAEFKIYHISTGSDTQDMFGIEASGYLALTKTSSNKTLSSNNNCYSLAGAQYGIYSDEKCTSKVCTVKTDVNGYAKSDGLNIGTYYIKEEVAPTSYVLNPTVIKAKIKCAQTTELDRNKTEETPKLASLEMLLQKLDKESQDKFPLGSASLQGAQFLLKYFDNFTGKTDGEAKHSWTFKTDNNGTIQFQDPDNYLVSGDELFKASDSTYALPLGTYTLQETKTPEGYLLSKESMTIIIKADNTNTEKINAWNTATFLEQVKRGDLCFSKKEATTGKHMAHIPFKLTSKTTGESHILVTDENGYFSSTSSWNAHTLRTNSNDAILNKTGEVDETRIDARAGIWFAQTNTGTLCSPNDELGALPYDTYILEELPCTANANMKLIVDDDISITRDSTGINLGTLDNFDNPDESKQPTTPHIQKKQTPDTEKKTSLPFVPKTGDNNYFPILITFLAFAGVALACIEVVRKKRKTK